MRIIENIHELRQIQMGILDYVHMFCKEHGITYFLSSGSLLGAVRHGGYIPWDDDIDIYMPRNEYERLLNEFPINRQFKLLDPSKENHYFYTYAKVVDTRTLMIEDEVEGYKLGVYIDVFPIDYVTDDLMERERIFKQKKLLYKIRRCKISKNNFLRSKLAYFVYRNWPITVKQIERRIHKLIIRDTPTHTVCNMTEAGPTIKHCFPAEDMSSQVDIKFEDRTYKTMVGYKDYLECTYGDYMTLPPVEERATHHFKAYWL